MMIRGNTGVTVGSEWCGFCRVHGCEGYKMYYREHKKKVSSFDNQDVIGYVNKNRTRNCQLDAAENYNNKLEKIFVRISPELKFRFQKFCEDNSTSMNAEIVSLIEADLEGN